MRERTDGTASAGAGAGAGAKAGAIVALDLGGIIVDVDRARTAGVLGVAVADLEEVFFDGVDHDELTRGALHAEAFVSRAATRAGCAPATVRAAWQAMVEVSPEGRALVDELLRAGYAVHLWSNTDPLHLEKIVAALPRGLLVDTVSFKLGAPKPLPAYWSGALAHGRPVIYVDDRADFVAAALRAGVPSVTCMGPAAARAALVEAGLLSVR